MLALATWVHGVLGLALLGGGIAAAEGVCRLLMRWRPLRQVRISLRLLLFAAVLFGAAYVAAPFLGSIWEAPADVGSGAERPILNRTVVAMIVLMAVIVAARLIESLVVQGWLGARAETALPTLARQIVFLAIVVIATLIVLDVYFKTPPSALLASSVVISAVVGLSLQQTLGAVAAGVALQSESTCRRGDWVGIGDLEGEVVRMTWRTIRLRTRENDVVIIPNDHAARSLIVNYSQPSRVHAAYVEVGTHYRHSPDLVRAVLRDAALAADGVLDRPEPHIWVTGFDDFAVRFKVKFFLKDYALLPDIQAAIMSNIWYAFRRRDIQIPFPIRTVSVTPDTAATRDREEETRVDDLRGALRGADLLRPLSDDEIDALARSVETPVFGQGEMLFEQGEAGRSCYLIRTGRVAVHLRDEREHDIHLADLGPGDILGEMSLLTGEARSARAIAEEETTAVRIGHEAFGAILKANPEIAESLAAMIEKRLAENEAARKAAAEADRTGGAAALSRRHIVHRILTFFGIRRRTGGSPPS